MSRRLGAFAVHLSFVFKSNADDSIALLAVTTLREAFAPGAEREKFLLGSKRGASVVPHNHVLLWNNIDHGLKIDEKGERTRGD